MILEDVPFSFREIAADQASHLLAVRAPRKGSIS